MALAELETGTYKGWMILGHKHFYLTKAKSYFLDTRGILNHLGEDVKACLHCYPVKVYQKLLNRSNKFMISHKISYSGSEHAQYPAIGVLLIKKMATCLSMAIFC